MMSEWLNYQHFEPLGHGEYPCEITAVESLDIKSEYLKEGGPKTRYQITLELLQPEYEGRALNAFANAIISNRSKLGSEFLIPLFGSWLEDNPFNIQYIVGLRVSALVTEKTKTKDDDTRVVYDEVTGFRPIAKAFENGAYTIKMAKAKIMKAAAEQSGSVSDQQAMAAPSPEPEEEEPFLIPTEAQ